MQSLKSYPSQKPAIHEVKRTAAMLPVMHLEICMLLSTKPTEVWSQNNPLTFLFPALLCKLSLELYRERSRALYIQS